MNNIRITCSAFAEMTGERTSQSHTVPEAALSSTLDDIVSSFCDHYEMTPFEERPVVDIKIEFLEA